MRRISLAAASFLIASLGLSTLFFSVDSTGARTEYIIEVNEDDFNPPSCTVNKGTTIRWKNIGSEVRRVIKPNVGVNSPPLFDSGDLLPGETSKRLEFTLRDNWNYRDFYDETLTGKIIVPNGIGLESCDLQPPTSTPTLTPTATPTPDESKAIVPGVSRGGPPPTATPTPTATMDPPTDDG